MLPALRDDQRQEAKVYRERLDNMAGFLTSINALLNVLLDSGKGQLRMQLAAGKPSRVVTVLDPRTGVPAFRPMYRRASSAAS